MSKRHSGDRTPERADRGRYVPSAWLATFSHSFPTTKSLSYPAGPLHRPKIRELPDFASISRKSAHVPPKLRATSPCIELMDPVAPLTNSETYRHRVDPRSPINLTQNVPSDAVGLDPGYEDPSRGTIGVPSISYRRCQRADARPSAFCRILVRIDSISRTSGSLKTPSTPWG